MDKNHDKDTKHYQKGKTHSSVHSMVLDLYHEELHLSDRLAKKLSAIYHKALFQRAREYIEQSKPVLAASVTDRAISALCAMENLGLPPLSIYIDNFCGDTSLYLTFNTCTHWYRVHSESDCIILERGSDRTLLRRDAGTGNVTDPDYRTTEMQSVNDLYQHLSQVKKDTHEDRVAYVRGLGDMGENWHINYKKSGRIDDTQIQNALKVLGAAENGGAVILCIFPDVCDIKTGEPSVSVSLVIEDTKIIVSLLRAEMAVFQTGQYLKNKVEVETIPFQECFEKLENVLYEE